MICFPLKMSIFVTGCEPDGQPRPADPHGLPQPHAAHPTAAAGGGRDADLLGRCRGLRGADALRREGG